jgi:hypothetical protein
MKHLVQDLIEALRDELKEYGEMLALLEQSETRMPWVTAVHAQAVTIASARSHREVCRRRVANHLRLPEDSSWPALLPRFATEQQPLLQALIQENHELFIRVQQRASQHHQLLHRITELMQRSVGSLSSDPERTLVATAAVPEARNA